jgi:hypothetical protein
MPMRVEKIYLFLYYKYNYNMNNLLYIFEDLSSPTKLNFVPLQKINYCI